MTETTIRVMVKAETAGDAASLIQTHLAKHMISAPRSVVGIPKITVAAYEPLSIALTRAAREQ